MERTKISNTENLVRCSLFVALIVVGTFIKIPIPVVPFTLQFLFTNLAGVFLGGKLGAITVGVYIVIGLIGIPVFSNGGGIGYIMQPTFGYILGFLAGAFVTGKVCYRSKDLSFKSILKGSFLGLCIVYVIGMLYYYIVANFIIGAPIGVGALVWYCFILAVPGDIFLCVVSAFVGEKVIKRKRRCCYE